MSWWRKIKDALTGKDEVPTAPSFKRQAEDFVRHYPDATVGDWIGAYQRACALAWEAGYQAGYMTKVVIGSVELPSDAEEEEEVQPLTQHDLSKVVELQDAEQFNHNVVFVDEKGFRVE